MNHIPFPSIEGGLIDDFRVIFNLARNHQLASFPLLLDEQVSIIGAYIKYSAAKGNAHKIATISPKCGAALKGLYKATYRKSTPKDLLALKEYGKKRLDLACPMCGSLGTSTLDHVLPQAKFPEFAIFSLNLVPACHCNSLRQDKTTGSPGERVLHPYFDAILSKRLLQMKAIPSFDAPEFKLTILLDENDPMFKAVSFHVKNVVMRTAIISRLINRWAQLIREPAIILPKLPGAPITIGELGDVIKEELSRQDRYHKSKNNWESIFIAGLQEQGVMEFLLHRVNSPAPAVL